MKFFVTYVFSLLAIPPSETLLTLIAVELTDHAKVCEASEEGRRLAIKVSKKVIPRRLSP
jgi:hypothetical protein